MLKRTIRNSYYAYKLIDGRSDEVFYVGKGIHARMYAHKTEAQGDPTLWTNPHKCRKILKILAKGARIHYEYVLCDSEQAALILEQEWIRIYGISNDGGTLTNISAAGQVANPQTKPIDVYDKHTSQLLHTFKSATEAARQLNISDPGTIRRCLNHYDSLRACKGFVFQYHGEPFSYVDAKIKTVVAKKGADMLYFSGTKAAATYFERSVSCIRQSCTHMWTIEGYVLSYQST